MKDIRIALDRALAELTEIRERYERKTSRLLKAWADDPGEGDWQETRKRILEDE